ncbi:hypothetical protein [Vasconcelosia minhoensis]|uniref:hypothetical protein n=1 Tax=Vasconcelosia minhoensis TaxID=3366354 RepID=UPI001D14729E|nr:hypothetical protein [Romeria gracilis]
MTALSSFRLVSERRDYAVSQLTPQAAGVLQGLFEQCADFFVMTNGVPAVPTAAQAEFEELPDGKAVEDIQVVGLFDMAIAWSARLWPCSTILTTKPGGLG